VNNRFLLCLASASPWTVVFPHPETKALNNKWSLSTDLYGSAISLDKLVEEECSHKVLCHHRKMYSKKLRNMFWNSSYKMSRIKCVFYLMTVSVAQIICCWMTGQWMNNELNRMWKKAVVA
jgi:hypothetical protein